MHKESDENSVTTWITGLSNLLNFELGLWFKTHRWWIQTLIWVLLLDGSLFMTLTVASSGILAAEQLNLGLFEFVSIYIGLFGFVTPLAIIFIVHNTILYEKQSGITSWILSKPVSRPAYVLAKFLGNYLGLIFTIVLIPGIIAYLLLSFGFLGELLNPSFLVGFGLLMLETAFYASFTLMLSTLFRQQVTVLAVAVGFFLSQQILTALFPPIVSLLPFALSGVIFTPFALSQQLPIILPIILTSLYCLAAILFAVWRFKKEEL
jgi:ABC-2 type transport system permease protein